MFVFCSKGGERAPIEALITFHDLCSQDFRRTPKIAPIEEVSRLFVLDSGRFWAGGSSL